jgi:hypothetical protein
MGNFVFERDSDFAGLVTLGVEPASPDTSAGTDQLFESVTVDGKSIDDARLRAMAMGAVMTWVEQGEFDYSELEALVIGVTDLDGEEEVSKDEEEFYSAVWDEVPNALLSLGGSAENITDFIDNEDDDAGSRLGARLKKVLDEETAEDSEIVLAFAEGSEDALLEGANEADDGGFIYESIMQDKDGNDMLLEAAFKKVKVIKDGKVTIKKKRVSGKARLSAAQKAGLKKARRKANSAAARKKRKKSMKQRKARGM